MKAAKIIYWISTVLLSLMMTFSAYAYFSQPAMKDAFQHLGFPDYFRIELAFAKLTGVVLLLSFLKNKWKEWGYAGFFIVFVSAIIAHSASGDPAPARLAPVIALVLLAISYFTYNLKSKTEVQSSSLPKTAFV